VIDVYSAFSGSPGRGQSQVSPIKSANASTEPVIFTLQSFNPVESTTFNLQLEAWMSDHDESMTLQ
jgi:hypothetical protein